MRVVLRVVSQIKSNLNKRLADEQANYLFDWDQNLVSISSVLGIFEVESSDPSSKFRFKTPYGSSEIIITDANFKIRSIE